MPPLAPSRPGSYSTARPQKPLLQAMLEFINGSPRGILCTPTLSVLNPRPEAHGLKPLNPIRTMASMGGGSRCCHPSSTLGRRYRQCTQTTRRPMPCRSPRQAGMESSMKSPWRIHPKSRRKEVRRPHSRRHAPWVSDPVRGGVQRQATPIRPCPSDLWTCSVLRPRRARQRARHHQQDVGGDQLHAR